MAHFFSQYAVGLSWQQWGAGPLYRVCDLTLSPFLPLDNYFPYLFGLRRAEFRRSPLIRM